MSNLFSKAFQDGEGLSEADLDTLFQTIKPSLSNLSQATSGSSSGDVLRSAGTNTAPIWSDINTIINNTTISSTAANTLFNSLSNLDSSAANLIWNQRTRAVGSSVTSVDIGRGAGSTFEESTSTTYVDLDIGDVEITTQGRPVLITFQSFDPDEESYCQTVNASSGEDDVFSEMQILRDTSVVAEISHRISNDLITGSDDFRMDFPPSCYCFIDTPAAGTYTYQLQGRVVSGQAVRARYLRLVVYEL